MPRDQDAREREHFDEDENENETIRFELKTVLASKT